MRITLLVVLLSAPNLLAVDYLKDVKPLLAARCYACHGALQQKAKLRLDTVVSMREAEVVIPGKGAESALLQHVLAEEGFSRMPPESEGEALSPSEVKLLRDWIDGGAIAPPQEQPDPDPREHWAFQAAKRPTVPVNAQPHPIDAYLEAARQRQGLTAASPAEPLLLLRRVCLDLTGLPPTAELQAQFLKDSSPTNYAKIVEKLLASPQYGERWGRHFLDIWRYSDWWGLGAELRNSQRHIWHWRDYVIENFNADTPYFQMIQEMLAADELAPNDLAKLRATGYLARPYFLFNRTTWLDEVLEHTAKGLLGLTFNCAKCHDHKYDPISMKDYYRLRAIFEPYQVRTELVPGVTDVLQNGIPRAFDCNLDVPTYKHERGDDRRPLKDTPITPGLPELLTFEPVAFTPVKLPLEAHAPHLRNHVEQCYRSPTAERLKQVKAKLESAKGKPSEEAALKLAERELALAELEHDMVGLRFAAERARYSQKEQFPLKAQAAALQEKKLAVARVEVELAKLAVDLQAAKPDQKAAIEKKRPALEQNLAKAKDALKTPGETYTRPIGAVKSAESNVESAASRNKPFPDTSTGRRTTLARWIADARNPLTARVLVNHVWLRHFGKPLVATVFDFGRKGAAPTHPELLDWLTVEFTEHNTSLKHLHRVIVTSQAYQMSSSSKGLEANLTRDPENKLLWRQNAVRLEAQAIRDSLLSLAGKLDLTLGGPPIPIAQQDASLRRSLYFFHSHNEHNKFLGQFDDANVLDCYRRTESIVPQQALTLANSKFALTMTDAIAQKLLAVAKPTTDDAFTRLAFRMILGSEPSAAELATCQEALAQWKAVLIQQKHADPTTKSRINLVGALLNHNDFVTLR